ARRQCPCRASPCVPFRVVAGQVSPGSHPLHPAGLARVTAPPDPSELSLAASRTPFELSPSALAPPDVRGHPGALGTARALGVARPGPALRPRCDGAAERGNPARSDPPRSGRCRASSRHFLSVAGLLPLPIQVIGVRLQLVLPL